MKFNKDFKAIDASEWPEIIRSFRDQHGLTQAGLGDELGMGKSTIVAYWEGGIRTPKPYLYLALQALEWRLESRGKRVIKKG